MLSEIRIQNFAIIDQLEVQFSPGFNVITGETGAGKSIIIDAVEMMLGGRADSDFVRAGNDRAIVEGQFKLPERLQKLIEPVFKREGIDQTTPEEVTMTRELRANGRNICRIDGTSVNLQLFRDIGERLIDIHGQSEHLSLLKPSEHQALLDRFANVDMHLRVLEVAVDKLQSIRAELKMLIQDEAALSRRADMLKYQIEEITAVNPQAGEDDRLQDESLRLANTEQLANLTAEATNALDGEDDSGGLAAVALLSQVAVLLAKLERLDPRFDEEVKLSAEIATQAEELARTLHHYADSIEHNPARLEEVEDRLDALNRLKKKYGGTLDTVIAFKEKAETDLAMITHSGQRVKELQLEEERLLREIGKMGSRLSELRKAAAVKLSRGIERELADLRMEGARFDVAILQEDSDDGAYVGDQRLAFDRTGIDQIEFLMAANRGEPLKSLAKVASGGETARIMLALKSVLSRADQTPTLIFDEIDQGIGGRVGATVGQKLWSLSDGHQVLCVTHLAQLAGFGDAHFKVAKGVRGDRTVTTVTPLNDRARVDELAEMLGAETVSAKQSAHDILMLARRAKEGTAGDTVQTPIM